MADVVFSNRKINKARLLAYGFAEENGGYVLSSDLLDGQFTLNVFVSREGKITTRVIDCASQDEYVLFLVPNAVGAFVGKVRKAYEDKLAGIAANCFDLDVFKSSDARKVIRYIAEKYSDRPEFLWERFSENAIFRRRDNSKWYAALLIVQKAKIGLSGNEKIEILDLRVSPDEVDMLVDGKKFFPGYHMNKKNWVTICLDGSLPIEEIFARIDTSYQLAKKK